MICAYELICRVRFSVRMDITTKTQAYIDIETETVLFLLKIQPFSKYLTFAPKLFWSFGNKKNMISNICKIKYNI